MREGTAHFIQTDLATAHELASTWDALRWDVEQADTTHAGPLDREVDQAGAARGDERLQRAITLQVESVRRDALHARIVALRPEDPRRRAWLASGRGSRQWVTSLPKEHFSVI